MSIMGGGIRSRRGWLQTGKAWLHCRVSVKVTGRGDFVLGLSLSLLSIYHPRHREPHNAGYFTSLEVFKFSAFSLGSFTATFIDSMWVLELLLCQGSDPLPPEVFDDSCVGSTGQVSIPSHLCITSHSGIASHCLRTIRDHWFPFKDFPFSLRRRL